MITFNGIIKEFIEDNDTREELQQIIDSPFNIKNFDSPTESMCQMAVELNPESIQFIKNPSEETMKKALDGNPYTLRHFIDKATPEIRAYALEIEPLAIKYIPDPSEEEQVYAVDKNQKAFDYIDEDVLKQRTSAMYIAKYHKVGFLPF